MYLYLHLISIKVKLLNINIYQQGRNHVYKTHLNNN